MRILKPPPLRPGDTVGIVSPSWGGAGAFPHRTAQGVKQLHALGFTVKLGLHALNQHGTVSDTADKRAEDILGMFADPEVKLVLAAIGGDHARELLPLLDYDLIRNNPKIFMGYSDITVLNLGIWKMAGLVTFNGPALLTDFAEWPEMFDYTATYMLKALTQENPIGLIEPSTWWTDEFQHWEEKEDQLRPRQRFDSPGWTWLKGGLSEGHLVGGALESLHELRAGPYWPDWEEAIFFFETTEEKPSPDEVGRWLREYEDLGVLEKLRGLLVGRPYAYTQDETAALDEILLEITAGYDFPIVTGMDFGHTAPQFTLPVGCRARIDTHNQRFEILEAAVQG